MDERKRKHFSRLDPELSDWLIRRANGRWQRNQSAAFREGLLLLKRVEETDSEQMVEDLLRGREARLAVAS